MWHKTVVLATLIMTTMWAKTDIKVRIQEMLPSEVQVQKVQQTHASLYTAFLASGDVLYVDLENGLILYGGLLRYDKKSKSLINLSTQDTNAWQSELEKKALKNINVQALKKLAVLDKVNGGNAKQEIIMFDNKACGFCKKVNDFFDQEGIKVNAYRIYNAHPLNLKALKDTYKVKTPKDRIAKMEQAFNDHQVRGTPQIFVLKGDKVAKVIRGADMEQIKTWIK